MATAKAKKDERPERKQLIINQKKVDKFNIVCKRIEFTPGVCDICGFDVCDVNDLGDYWEMDTEMQAKVKEAVVRHKEEAHSQASQNIVYEDEQPEKWLGKSREEKARKRAEQFG
jgi:hypothetical protein